MHKLNVQSFSFIFALSTAACLGCSLLSAVVVVVFVVVVLAIVIATIVTFNYVETATDEADFVLVYLRKSMR